eukprot:6015816-Ditylum_brightwellii.AAC.1
MIRKQNHFLCNTVSVSIIGLKDIDSLGTAPGFQSKISFHCWLPTIKTKGKLTTLFKSVDSDPNKPLVTTNQQQICSYKDEPAGNTAEAAQAFDNLLKGNMDAVNDNEVNEVRVVEDRIKYQATHYEWIMEENKFLERASKQIKEWKNTAKKRVHKREKAEKEISQASAKLEE